MSDEPTAPMNTEQALLRATSGQVRAWLRVWDDAVSILKAADAADKQRTALQKDIEDLKRAAEADRVAQRAAQAKADLDFDRMRAEREHTLVTLAQAIDERKDALLTAQAAVTALDRDIAARQATLDRLAKAAAQFA
jgi:hypothetical protein